MLFHSPSRDYSYFGIVLRVIHTEIGQALLSILYGTCNDVILLPRLNVTRILLL